MATRDNSLFSPTEAAFLTGLPLKAVNNAIDRKTVSSVVRQRVGHPIRLLDVRGLMSLALERRLASRLVPEARRQIFDALTLTPQRRLSLGDGLLTIDLREPRRELAVSMRILRRARELVIADPEIMGGDPVFRSTRVPVHLIAKLVNEGTPLGDLLESYPRLTAEMVRIAPTYAAAYPLRGRRRSQPWHDRQPVRRARRQLSAIEPG